MGRKEIPKHIRREVLTEAGYRMPVPTCRTVLPIDLHHVIAVSEEGGNDASNLIVLCPNCHALFHRGTINKDSIKIWKGMLISLNGAFDKLSIDNLLFLSDHNTTLIITGDGVIRFSNLISSGLADYSLINWDGNSVATYEIHLTDKGNILVEAWKKGDSIEFKKYF